LHCIQVGALHGQFGHTVRRTSAALALQADSKWPFVLSPFVWEEMKWNRERINILSAATGCSNQLCGRLTPILINRSLKSSPVPVEKQLFWSAHVQINIGKPVNSGNRADP